MQDNRPARQTPRPAQFWRDGFRTGAIDALRRATHRVNDPDVRAILAELSDDYERTVELAVFDKRIAALHHHPAVDRIGAAMTATQLSWLCRQIAL